MISQMTAAGDESVHLCQIDAGFGVSGADEYAAFLGAQWEDVAGLDDVFEVWRMGKRRFEWSGRGRRRKCQW